jgi:hypothetical protein
MVEHMSSRERGPYVTLLRSLDIALGELCDLVGRHYGMRLMPMEIARLTALDRRIEQLMDILELDWPAPVPPKPGWRLQPYGHTRVPARAWDGSLTPHGDPAWEQGWRDVREVVAGRLTKELRRGSLPFAQSTAGDEPPREVERARERTIFPG